MSDQIASLLPIIAFAVIFWLLLVRPAQRRRKQVAAMQSQLGIGDEVMLSSGFYGVVHGFSEDADGRVQLELSEGVHVSVARAAITEVLTRSSGPEFEDDPEPDYAADGNSPEVSEPKNPASES